MKNEKNYKAKTKNVVAGLGEIGYPIYKLLSRTVPTTGYDIKQERINQIQNKRYGELSTSFLHICIPFTKSFSNNTLSLAKRYRPQHIVIHSTIPPNTTHTIQKKLPEIPVIYSATRGVHKRMEQDLKRYVKFYAVGKKPPNSSNAARKYAELMKKAGVKTKQMSSPVALELAKIVVDTSYYGWLINYAQLSNMIANKHGVDYDEMWSFADEIHKYLGNRPKMFPGIIGGHCIIPNLDLIQNDTLNLIKELNQMYEKKAKKNNSLIPKKYRKINKKTR